MDNNFILLLVGKSGSGKSFIADCLNTLYGWKSVVSYTTRKPRYKDEKGHIFVNENAVPSQDEMVAYTKFNGNEYWATQKQIEESQIYIIDPKGVETFKEKYKGNKKVIVCYVDCSITERFKRMKQRVTQNNLENNIFNYEHCEDEALKRIENDGYEFKGFISNCNYPIFIITNGSNDVNLLLQKLVFIKNNVEILTQKRR